MPVSWRIEKFIYALWHAFVVYLFVIHMDNVDHYRMEKWLTANLGEYGVFIRHMLTIYVWWQFALFFLHMGNALTGEANVYFNFGTFRNFLRVCWYSMTNKSVSSGPTPYHNINRLMAFRESKMGAVTQREAADILRKTAALDAIAMGAYGGRGSNTSRAADNLNARLGAMTQSQGLEFLMNKKD